MKQQEALELLALYRRERAAPTPARQVRELFTDADRTGTSPHVLGVVLAAAWAGGGAGAGDFRWPMRALPRRDWIEMFRRTGYLYNGFIVPSMRPTTPIRLYRGCTREHRRGLSWTPRERDARWFGARYAGKPSRLYAIDAEPSWLLARFSGSIFGRGGEYVVDVPKGAACRIDAEEPR